jgi:hypothetical protein
MTNHSVRVVVSWTPTYIPGSINFYGIPCRDGEFIGYTTGGNLSYQVDNAREGQYAVNFGFNIPCAYPRDTVSGHYILYFDNSPAQEQDFIVGGCNDGTSIPGYGFFYTPPLISGYVLTLGNNQSCILTPTTVRLFNSNDCNSGTIWNKATEPISVNITSGNEYASFYDGNDELIGNSFTGTFSEFQNITLVQDSMYADLPEKYIVVEGNWAGIVKLDSMRIISQQGEFLTSAQDKDSLASGSQLNIEVYPNDLGCNVFIPEETTYNAEIISGNELGNLLEPNTNEPVQSFSGLYHWFGYAYFDYIADGTPVDSVDSVTIRISMYDPKIPYKDLTLYIKPSPLVVTVEPEFVAPGDTARLIIKKLNEDGTLTDYDTTQTFEVGMLDGCALGMIKTETDSGAYVYGATQPILFIADTSSNFGIIKLSVGLIEETGGSSRSVRNSLHKEIIENDKVVKNSERKIAFEKMMKEKQGNQTASSPENTETCWGGVSGTSTRKLVEFEKGDWIELLEPNQESEDLSITAETSMPNLHIKLRIKGLNQGTLRCSLKVNWKNLDQTGHPVYGATFEIPSQDPNPFFPIYEWDMNWGDIIVGGDDLELDVEYISIPNKVHKKTLKVPIKILGKDYIDAQLIRNYISTQLVESFASHMKIVIYFESSWEQFWESGYPKVVYHPHDWGLCALSKERPTIAEIWNWKENVNSGIQVLMGKYNWSQGYPQRVRNGTTWSKNKRGKVHWEDPISPHTDDWYPHAYINALNFNTEQVWKETHQRYLSGSYWRWYPDDPRNKNSSGKWIAEPSSKKHRRGELAWDKFINFPPEWR